jgi:Type II CAAX prenyl endopeptidase Rce1-like
LPDFFTKFVVLSLAVVVYYRFVATKIVGYSRLVAGRLQLARRYSFSEVDHIIRLALAGTSQLAFCLVLIWVGHLDLAQLGLTEVRPALILYGILLGIGEMALGSFLGYVGMRVAMVLASERVPTELKDWLTIARGGWMRDLLKTAEIMPLPLAFLSIILYIAIEETIFRGVLITAFLPAGTTWALGASILLFMLVQTFNMPSWSSAMFPLMGALVIGFLHGSLFLAVPEIVPLIVAHFVFFVSGLVSR